MAVATAYTDKTDEQKAITEMVRQFVDNEVIPVAEEHDHEDSFPDAVVEQMKELGLFGVTIPEEYGGMGGSAYDVYRTCEALARVDLGIATGVLATLLGSDPLRFGTPDQKRHWLSRIAEEGIVMAYGATEPQAGSDLAALRNSASDCARVSR